VSALAAGKSLNETAVDALAEGSGMATRPQERRDLGDTAGTWKAEKAVESALVAQDRVDGISGDAAQTVANGRASA
jgi:hypothetical protein